jgi:hypothetical protein
MRTCLYHGCTNEARNKYCPDCAKKASKDNQREWKRLEAERLNSKRKFCPQCGRWMRRDRPSGLCAICDEAKNARPRTENCIICGEKITGRKAHAVICASEFCDLEYDRRKAAEKRVRSIRMCNFPGCTERTWSKYAPNCEAHRGKSVTKTETKPRKTQSAEKAPLVEMPPAQETKEPTKQTGPVVYSLEQRINLIVYVDRLNRDGCYAAARILHNSFSRKDCPYRMEQKPVKIGRKEKQS